VDRTFRAKVEARGTSTNKESAVAVYQYPPLPIGFTGFDEDSPDPDTLILGIGQFLIGQSGDAVTLGPMGAWTVTIAGTLVSPGSAINLLAGNSGHSTITIQASGILHGANTITAASPVTIMNAGNIHSDDPFYAVVLNNDGGNTIVNTGTMYGGFAAIAGSHGGDTVINSGTLNEARLGAGNDTLVDFRMVGTKIVSGHITAAVSLGEGSDTFLGGNFAERVGDDGGSDSYKLGGGNDTYDAFNNGGVDGTDRVVGGPGLGDTYDASHALSDLRINIDGITHAGALFGYAAIAAGTATGTDVADAFKDAITGFEQVIGGGGNDLIYGSAVANQILGNAGGDILCGFAGNDVLNGGLGEDDLFGGPGRDILMGGGAGAGEGDRFQFASINDSGLTAATRDVISDFDGYDIINLFPIDAITTNAPGTNDAFTFIGNNVNFSHHPGELRARSAADGEIVEGDVNGDGKPDFSIAITDPGQANTFSAGLFFL
jgi:RTX calcium-binding nonapeptide repeat (4 copies)